MASRPHLQSLAAAIEKIGGDDVIFDQIADGVPMRKIAEPFGYSRQMIYAWIHMGGPEREKRWEESKQTAAHALVEDAGDILEAGRPVTSAEASHLKARVEHKRWLASVFNRKVYGDDSGKIDVQLNIGQLHLDALRAAGSRHTIQAEPERPALPAAEADYEVVD
jgi:hypothetical protein